MATAQPSKLEDKYKISAFIGNLPPHVSNSRLKQHFQQHARVLSARVMRVPKKAIGKGYGFVEVATEEDLMNLLELPRHDLTFGNHVLVVKRSHGKRLKNEPSPFHPNYQRLDISDRAFDLAPLDPSKTSGHILVCDVMRHILQYLTAEQAFKLERVCRRWQSIIYSLYDNISSVHLAKPGCPWTSARVKKPKGEKKIERCRRLMELRFHKMLFVTGERLLDLNIEDLHFRDTETLHAIGRLAPNLKCLHLKAEFLGENEEDLTPITKNCHQLQQISMTFDFGRTSNTNGLSHCKNLTTLKLCGTQWSVQELRSLPDTIIELSLIDVIIVDKIRLDFTIWNLALFPNLKKLTMHKRGDYSDISSFEDTRHGTGMFNQGHIDLMAQVCPNIELLAIEASRLAPYLLDFKHLTKLKSLTLIGRTVDTQKFLATSLPPSIEELSLQFTQNKSNVPVDDHIGGHTIDFSVSPASLRKIRVPNISLTTESYMSLSKMNNLKEIYFPGLGPLHYVIKQLVCMPQLSQLGVGNMTINKELHTKLIELRLDAHKQQQRRKREESVDLSELTLHILCRGRKIDIKNSTIAIKSNDCYSSEYDLHIMEFNNLVESDDEEYFFDSDEYIDSDDLASDDDDDPHQPPLDWARWF